MKNILLVILALFAGFQLIAQEKNVHTYGVSEDLKSVREKRKIPSKEEKVYSIVQKKAQPQEGMQVFYEDFIRKYNSEKVFSEDDEIKVKLKFIVEKDGSFTDIKYGEFNELNKRAVRVLKSMPKWEPAELNDKIVRSNFTLLITIKVNNEIKNTED